MGKWFLHKEEEITGPYSTEELEEKLGEDLNPENHAEVWGPGLTEWVDAPSWKANTERFGNVQSQLSDMKRWHIAVDGESQGPFTREEMLAHLKSLRNRNEAYLWTRGMPNWVPVWEFHHIMDQANINRRQHPRAPIQGQCVVKKDDQTYIFSLDKISGGGCGLRSTHGLKPRDVVSLEVKSEALGPSFELKAEVRYVGEEGYTGLKFVQPHMEIQSRIFQYIRQYQEMHGDKKAEVA